MSLEFRHIAHAYHGRTGRVEALTDIAFTAPTGKITCLLGSSGSGKSTLLNLAAGLLPVQEGSISVGGEEMANASQNPPPEARPIGLVFQDGALFPHMTIAKNIAFGLKSGGNAGIVEEWLTRVGLAGLGPRFPHELSGGQQQRASLARAMAPEPQVLLMDEPFSSVDIVLRRRLRRDCRRLLHEAGTTTILVTHDPEEALDIADHIAVMESGRIIQFGTPDDLHERPATPSVGAVFGGAQIVKARREGDALLTAMGSWPLSCIAGDVPPTGEMDLLVHAEALECRSDAEGLVVVDVHPLGVASRLALQSQDGAEITVQSTASVEEGARYAVVPREGSVRAFSRN